MTPHVILVDDEDEVLGVIERDLAHRKALLHRAVSVFVVNERGEVLLQRRAPTKRLFAGRWANTSCTHPRPGEGLVAAGVRCLSEEMGLEVELVRVGSFVYRAVDETSGHVEHELDHVLLGRCHENPTLDPEEADDYSWVDLTHLQTTSSNPKYAPWLAPALDLVIDRGWGRGHPR